MQSLEAIKVRVKARTFSYKRERYKKGQSLSVPIVVFAAHMDALEAVSDDGPNDTSERPRTLTRRVK